MSKDERFDMMMNSELKKRGMKAAKKRRISLSALIHEALDRQLEIDEQNEEAKKKNQSLQNANT